MDYFTVLIAAGTKKELTETIQADDIEAAIKIVKQKYPDTTFRLVRGKKIPQKEAAGAMKKKPNSTWAKKK